MIRGTMIRGTMIRGTMIRYNMGSVPAVIRRDVTGYVSHCHGRHQAAHQRDVASYVSYELHQIRTMIGAADGKLMNAKRLQGSSAME
jgi:hypothetical protein